ncbi:MULTISPECIES: type II toxin-antitoxin system RelE family toxin [Serratia]|jgi:mRNA interferase RelE/StbE|uniref:Type II toxin-antitoxin system RelE/ParE family toxin n=1 Tax=Serratia marcescens TaxID=615 RepID=A0ABD6HRL5_SERMA|nr:MULTISPECIES: type II toxin-antitoxin system RelE/ParE family toxin [Serratia]MCI2401687.1 type II toxin-antitoxin system RelE/ParE family toxin [Serratia sp. PGPR-27]MVF03672.1 type II toxin-antitoxin system RelE/ParE family toxin [Serratia marcescens]PNU51540.1 type II toxin-antitoxin system RelE/ParE family toxin [Serratia marcescens]CAI1163063.1 Plasmid stabilisation system protein [Serratia marcescens]CAI1195178.1 Plasmid stabilisation system protein [Serratia marcescens]
MAKISWSRKALKQLMTLPAQNRLAIAAKVEELGAFPAVRLDIKKLHDADNQYRLRVGNYRIIFEIVDEEPIVCLIQQVKRRTSTTY